MPEATTDTPNPSPVSPIAEIETQISSLIKDPNHDREAITALYEKRAFAKWYETQPEGTIPNVNNLEDAFKSYKSLQGHATKVSQENSELRRKVTTQETKAPEAAPVTTAPVLDETGAPQIKAPEAAPVEQPKTNNPFITTDEYEIIRNEVLTTGKITDERRSTLVAKGVHNAVIDDMIEAGKARAAIAWKQATDTVGSKERLAQIFEWVGNTRSGVDLAEINKNLANPSMVAITLRGLAADFDRVVGSKPKEPVKLQNQSTASTLPAGAPAYTSIEEFKKDRNDFRFKTDSAFRNLVFERANKTPFLN